MIELCKNDKNFLYGLRCLECDKDIIIDDYYIRRYIEEDECEIICVECGLKK